MRAFRCSGKIRLNANGRRLDAWLIYKCLTCDKTWNRPIFERQSVREIDPIVLEALRSNDPQWVRTEAFNVEALRRKAQRIDLSSEIDIEKKRLQDADDFTEIEIELLVPFPVTTRLDRLLACELGISRARLKVLHDERSLLVAAGRADALRRSVKNGTLVTLILSGEAQGAPLWKARVAPL